LDSGLRSPLIDFFRRGEVARDVRLQAAQGALAPRAHEQLGLLMLLLGDHDPEIAKAAEQTLTAIPRDALAAFLARSDATDQMREFFKGRGIEPAGAAAADADAPLLDLSPDPEPLPEIVELPPLPGEPGSEGAASQVLPDSLDVPELPELPELPDLEPLPDAESDEQRKQSVTQKLASMTVAQRMGVAMKGSREERALLIRDPNKLVSTSVLSSPKLTETEVEAIAKMANVGEEILRIVGSNRAWVKNYNVVLALARNPKTPVAMSMNLLNRLNEKDLRQLSTNRNVPEVLRVTARKKIVIDKS
jgi:hypothetical protein